ncbi:hypothetical protein GJAV_G00128190 [Gymnothorax javanicus]|nr:hypothetical protein GJAV_G00128190 [Gymnothorax javanicus]
MERCALAGKIACLFLCAWALCPVSAQIRYSVPEELAHGAFVGSIAEDLGFDVSKLSARRFRIVSGARKQYLEVNLENGILFVNEKIDREELCGQTVPCFMHLQGVIENPLELYTVEIEVLDVNDHSPRLPWSEFTLDVSESAAPGSRYPLEGAQDPDAGTNSLRTYLLSVNDHFALDVQARSDGSKFAELVLQTPLDREQQQAHQMVLTAVDGGAPERSGTAQITVTVLDANDNAPVFDQSFYRVRLIENAPRGFLVIRLHASDLDEGSNGEITYSFSGHAPPQIRQLFSVDSSTGEIRVKGTVDYEKARMHEIYIQARDKGPYAVAVHCKVLVNVLDVNDNHPEVILTSVSSPVQEDAPPGTVVAVISVMDRDSGDNGNVDCEIPHNVPFQLRSSFTNYYTLITSEFLDRETVYEYNITITARDFGVPPLTTRKTVLIQVSDVNDNAPRFLKPSYTVYVSENNAPGASICAVSAVDPDSNHNAYLSYSVLEDKIQSMPVSTYVSINSDSGNIYALRSFDHEQLGNFQIRVQALDAGFPPLSSSVTINIFVVDQNDNAPVIVSPLPRNGTVAMEKVPRSADAGYLVAKITAVDADAGQNSRLSYQLLQATDYSLFSVALYTGEIRTIRRLQDKDGTRQRLVILVKDSGQPPLSASVSIILSVVDSAPGSLPGFDDRSLSQQPPSSLPMYSIVSLSSVSAIFLTAILVLAAIKVCRDLRSLSLCGFGSQASTEVFNKSELNLQASAAPKVPASSTSGDGTAPPSQTFSHKMCLTPHSTRSGFLFVEPHSASAATSRNCKHKGSPAKSTPNEPKQPIIDCPSSKDHENTSHQSCSALHMDQRAGSGCACDPADRAMSPGGGQYWTWGYHSRGRKASPVSGVPIGSLTPRFVTTATQHPPEPLYEERHNVSNPSMLCSPARYPTRCLMRDTQPDERNSFTTFGKRRRGSAWGYANNTPTYTPTSSNDLSIRPCDV